MEIARSPAADGLVVNIRGGARLSLPASINETATYVALEQDDWFEDEIRFIRRWLAPGMRAVDIGANFGLYTASMARAVRRTGQVWAFEPAPTPAGFLQQTIQLNDDARVTVAEAAISDRCGSVAFMLKERSELSSVAADEAATGITIAVPAVTLDEMGQRLQWPEIDFVKIDVEGHELQAIRGGLQFFRTQSPLVMVEIMSEKHFNLGALELLRELGYASYVLLPGSLILTDFDSAWIDPFQLNVFACKNDRAERLASAGFLARSAVPKRDGRGSEAWMEYARSIPYARELASRWSSRPGFFAGADARAYVEGLGAFARSRDRNVSPAERLGFLHEALTFLGEAFAAEDSLARSLSYARVAYELGKRDIAVTTLIGVHERLAQESEQALAVPFLAPSARHEAFSTDGRPLDWLRCAVTEQVERLRGHSSIFMDGTSLSYIEPILGLPFCSAEMHRRWQLARLALGIQKAPQPSPLLCQRSEENLNPEFWCGAAAA